MSVVFGMAEVGEVDSVVSEGCIQELLEVFSRGNYKARNALDRRVGDKMDPQTSRAYVAEEDLMYCCCIFVSCRIERDYSQEVYPSYSSGLRRGGELLATAILLCIIPKTVYLRTLVTV